MIPISRLTYAIGDVHGESALLAALLDAIAADAAARAGDARLIFLGDLVNRGPDSRGVIDHVIAALDRYPGSRVILGNHDDAFLHAITADPPDPAAVARWLGNGGRAALESYVGDAAGDFDRARALIRTQYPHHVALLAEAALLEVDGGYAFAHAGIDPARGLAEQARGDLLTIRSAFLDHAGPLPKTVVHGHSVTKSGQPEIHPHRIAVDTGVIANGRLSAVILDPDADAVGFLSVERTAEGIRTAS